MPRPEVLHRRHVAPEQARVLHRHLRSGDETVDPSTEESVEPQKAILSPVGAPAVAYTPSWNGENHGSDVFQTWYVSSGSSPTLPLLHQSPPGATRGATKSPVSQKSRYVCDDSDSGAAVEPGSRRARPRPGYNQSRSATRNEEVPMDGVSARPHALRAALGTVAAVVAVACLFAAAAPAHAATTVTGGTVTFVTDPAQSKAMFAGGIAPLAASPATLRLTAAAWRFRFPVEGGRIDIARSTGTVRARGALELWGRETMSVWTVMSFSGLTATIGKQARLTGVDAQGKRRVLGTLDLDGSTMQPSVEGGHRWLTVSNVSVRMSSWIRGELTDVFPRYEPSGTRLGTVSMKARLD